MDFTFTKAQTLLRKSVKEFLAKECPPETLRQLHQDPQAFDRGFWEKMVQLGYAGLSIPEAYEGTEGDFFDLLIFMEETGRHIAPSPFFSTVIQCARAILSFGSQAQKDQWLPQIAGQGAIWTLARTESTVGDRLEDLTLSGEVQDDQIVLNGRKTFVPYGSVADMLLVVARTRQTDDPRQGLSLVAVPTDRNGLGITLIPTAEHDLRCEIAFDQVRVDRDQVLGEMDQGAGILDALDSTVAVLKAAEMSGGAEAALKIVTDYARQRHQFQQPIGAFQGIQFTLADLLIAVEGLRNLVYEAGWHIAIGQPSAKLNAMTKARANQVYYAVCYHGMVIHGAIGWTEEMDLGLYHLRTRALQFDGGQTEDLQETIAAVLEQERPDFLKLYDPV